ncbi:MAG: hypothetical protein ACLP5H_29495 [Desulfomonilaceae bacterium]
MPQSHSAMSSWNTHAIITRAALSTGDVPRLDESIPVIALEAFLSLAKEPLRDLLKWYYELLDRKVNGAAAKRGATSEIPKEILTTGNFLAALKLNVTCPLHYVRVLRPEEMSPDTPHDASRAGPPRGMYVETGQEEAIQAREVLCTFSDEPDWGMDQDLFSVAQYGYGSCPFGPGYGPSSQAPFHMAFLHENPLVVALRPSLGRSFMGERIQLFFALAGVAMDSGVDYWGWRFAAWAMHYLQDLTQPYHARPFPAARLPLLIRFILHPNPRRFAAKNESYLKNRHILFESAVHFLLNEAVKKGADHPFLRALSGEFSAGGFDTRPHRCIGSEMGIRSLMRESSRLAATLARQIDRTMMALMDDPRISDPGYSLEKDKAYRIEDSFPSACEERPRLCDVFTRLVSLCLAGTGKVSRYAVRRSAGIDDPT